MNVSDDELTVPSGSTRLISEPQLKVEVAESESLGDSVKPFKELETDSVLSGGERGVENEFEGQSFENPNGGFTVQKAGVLS